MYQNTYYTVIERWRNDNDNNNNYGNDWKNDDINNNINNCKWNNYGNNNKIIPQSELRTQCIRCNSLELYNSCLWESAVS